MRSTIRKELPEAIEAFEADERVRCIVIRGAGPRAFVGADIMEFRAEVLPLEARRRMLRPSYLDAVAAATNPIIAALHGFCLGAGLEIALACDIRTAAEDAVFGLREINLGLLPGAGGTQRLPRLIGLGPALDMMLTGERITASEARRLGLISRIVPRQDDLGGAVDQLARSIAAKPPLAAACVKEAVRASASTDLHQGLVLEKDLFSLLRTTEDRREAAAAFQGKRSPRFSGR